MVLPPLVRPSLQYAAVTVHSKESASQRSDDGKPDTRPPMLVIASVDAIQLRKRLAIETDMTIQGQVVWTGSSSMDIRMELLQVCISISCHILAPTCNACFLPLGQFEGPQVTASSKAS